MKEKKGEEEGRDGIEIFSKDNGKGNFCGICEQLWRH